MFCIIGFCYVFKKDKISYVYVLFMYFVVLDNEMMVIKNIKCVYEKNWLRFVIIFVNLYLFIYIN